MTASEQIDNQIASYTDWKGEVMAQLRTLVHKADPEIIEEWKWGTGVYTKNSMVCAISAFKDHVKINFFQGAALEDKHRLLNAGMESKLHRAIDFKAGDKIEESKTIDLIKEAVMHNLNKKK